MTNENPSPSEIDLADLKQTAQSLGFEQLGWPRLAEPLTMAFYERWIAQDYHGSMDYLRDHLEFKKNPQLIGDKYLLPHSQSSLPRNKNLQRPDKNLQSALVLTHSYYPIVHAAQSPSSLPASVRIAKYAQNSDYHYWFKEKLKALIEKLQTQYPDEVFLPFTDSGPVLERDLAARAGLGWFGKNTCLIHPKKGSLFFIGEILTSLPAPDAAEKPRLPDFCGKCTRCIEVCPTQALESPRVLNANKCISFLTIESKESPPPNLRSQIGDWFFGCDLCQTVCPWNEKIFKFEKSENQHIKNPNTSEDEINFFHFILTASNKKLQKSFHGSPLLRATAFGLKRNALIVIGNKKIVELLGDVQTLQQLESTKPSSKLLELVNWCLGCLNSAKSKD